MTVVQPTPSAVTSPDRTSATTAAGISWLQYARHRSAFRSRWPSIWDMKIITSFFDDAAVHVGHIESALDVGATDRVWEPTIRRLWPGVDYRSLDIDHTNVHDYYGFAEVGGQYDLVTCFEVLEHVEAKVCLELLEGCVDACRPGGYVLVSVPNIFTPGAQLEFTHQTAFNQLDLVGLLTWVGLKVIDASRVFFGSARRRLAHQYLLAPLHRAMNVDFCRSVVALARKPEA
ncbi:MAG: methyltransferase domain-containing protein [Phycisphaerales bacterium]